MAAKTALIVWGGWDGHQPEQVANLFRDLLVAESFDVELSDTLDAFLDADKLANLNLIVPVWTMGKITSEQCNPVVAAVRDHGVGIAGCHGGMCDSFRENTEWQWLTGGQWVAHPGNDGVRYTININHANPHPITHGLGDFEVVSEQYYLHTDPGNSVLATTDFPHAEHGGPHVDNPCKMPQIWTRSFGKGRVFYNALGHQRVVLEEPTAHEITRRGLVWAAK